MKLIRSLWRSTPTKLCLSEWTILPLQSKESLVRLLDRHNPVCIEVVQFLLDSAGPANLNLLDAPVCSQAEVHARVAGRRVPNRGGDLVPLRIAIFRCDADLRANRHAIAFPAHQVQQDPMVVTRRDVTK